ncbi:MAG TPA: hypothetical protein VI006_06070 [Solirubrobacteraceae bacterium]
MTRGPEPSAGFGTAQLLHADSRLALAVLNHLRYRALNRVFGMSRDQVNLLTVVLLLSAADGAYEAARRISGMRLRVSGAGAGFGVIALREAVLGVAGPSTRQVPGAGTLLSLAILGGLAAPTLRRTAHTVRAAEQRLRATEERVRRERIRRYAAARASAT